MQLIDELRAEHDLIEQVVGSLRTFVDQRQAGQGEAADGQSFLRFFRLFAGHFHHAREEDTLVIALTRDAELPADRGPIAVMLADHARMAAMLDAMEPLIGTALPGEAERARLQELTTPTRTPSGTTSTPRTRCSCPRARSGSSGTAWPSCHRAR